MPTISEWGTVNVSLTALGDSTPSAWGTVNVSLGSPRFHEFRVRTASGWKLMRLYPL